MVAEGVRTVPPRCALARARGVTMPICEAVAAVLFEAASRPPDALAALLDARAAAGRGGRPFACLSCARIPWWAGG